jgi:D-glycero-alpha-D-manno-heptose-7-phosphate kinase
MGSSSNLVITLLNSLFKIFDFKASHKLVAEETIYIEQVVLKDSVGCQDQIMSCFSGGLNVIKFSKLNLFKVLNLNKLNPIFMKNLSSLTKNLFLCSTGIFRSSSKVSYKYLRSMKSDDLSKVNLFNLYYKLIKKFVIYMNLKGISNFDYIGYLLNSAWLIKKSINKSSTDEAIDFIYKLASKKGALGGKVLGAGSGGFMLLYIPDGKRSSTVEFLGDFFKDNISVCYCGSSVQEV